MSVLCRLLNGICCLLYRKEHRRFTSSCNVKEVQERYLFSLLEKNADTVYGRKHGFGEIRSYEDFARKVPLTVYEDYEPYISAMAEGKTNVLTAERVKLFELTSGSSGGKKMIPYTQLLKNEFQRGIKPWLYDIYTGIEGVREGKSYWSITPVTAGKTFTKSGIPIGFEEDAEYFGFIEQAIMKRLFAVDGSVKFSDDIQKFYFDTAAQLINCKDLTLISVWNPTFLTILCDHIRSNSERLALTLPEKRRSDFLRAAEESRFDRIFPRLRIISCWADGSAADYVGEIRKRFPDVLIQPKGLLATECFTSFPLCNETGSRLSVYSHFFEFRSLTDGTIVTADRLQKGEYEVIVTTGGGFYRYCIGDVIEVLEVFENAPPLIKFLRRSGISSDLFGEKLTEDFVRNVCTSLVGSQDFCLLAPEGNGYCLYTSCREISADMLDNALRESYHYNYCRQLGQLAKAKVTVVCGNPADVYINRLCAEGMRIGDIKPAYLSKKTDWNRYFEIERTE